MTSFTCPCCKHHFRFEYEAKQLTNIACSCPDCMVLLIIKRGNALVFDDYKALTQ